MKDFIKVDKKGILSIDEIISYQIMNYCFFEGINISKKDLKYLVQLSKSGKQQLETFCTAEAEKTTVKSAQAVRNSIGRSEKAGLVVKEGVNRKKVYINPDLNIQTKGNIWLDYKYFTSES